MCLNFYLLDTPEDHELLEKIETLRHRDRWSVTQFLKEACIEYVGRHFPGNPGPPLNHWIDGEPFSEAAQEKLRKRATVAEKSNKLSDEDFARLFPEHARRIREEAQKRK